jgi:2'-5' RNA ligase
MRCFIAAWPQPVTRAALQRQIDTAARHVGSARAMRPRNLHLTAAFIGSLDVATAARVAGVFSTSDLRPFDWTIDTLGWFPRARVAWAGGPGTASLASTVAQVRGLLDDLGVSYDRKPFVPHVTLFRDVRQFAYSGPLAEPIPWLTDHVALYAAARDEHGAVYLPVGPADSLEPAEPPG